MANRGGLSPLAIVVLNCAWWLVAAGVLAIEALAAPVTGSSDYERLALTATPLAATATAAAVQLSWCREYAGRAANPPKATP